jgi:glycosyltransferase involved in cell wall biosynthesis
LRILLISDHADPLAKIGAKESGGQNIYVMNVATLLARRGHQVDVYTRWDARSKREVVQVRRGLRVIRVAAGPQAYMPRDQFLNITDDFAERIKERIAREELQYDVIFTHYWFSGIIGLQLAQEYQLPLAHVYHSIGRIKYEALKKINPAELDGQLFEMRCLWEKRIAQEATSIITTSPVEEQDIVRLFEVPRDKIACITIGVDTQLFRPRSQKWCRQKLKLPQDAQIVLYVGRLELRKGISTLIRAVNTLAGAELYIVGGGSSKSTKAQDQSERNRLQDVVRELGVTHRVHFVGAKPQQQLAQYYSAADVCAVPSYYEPFGIVPIEAMACGTPVVASDTGGMRYTVQEGVTGHLTKAYDFAALAGKLRLTLQDGKEHYTAAARNHVLHFFAWPKIGMALSHHLISLQREAQRTTKAARKLVNEADTVTAQAAIVAAELV